MPISLSRPLVKVQSLPEAAAVAAGTVVAVGIVAAEPTEEAPRQRANAAVKMEMLQEMVDEKAATRRMEERRKKWRQHNAATTIKARWTTRHR